MAEEPFFSRAGDCYTPNPISRGPWHPNALHGRVIAGLLGSEIERRHGDPAFNFSRLTIDLWRQPTFVPMEVKTHVVRDGGRIRVIDAECFGDGVAIGRASGVLLRRGEEPDGDVWTPEPWDMPPPEDLPLARPGSTMPGSWQPMWETRAPGGRWFGDASRNRVWMRDIRPLVDDEPLTPFARVALACDYASPLANAGSAGNRFINADITLYLHRLPVSDWLGFEAEAHNSSEGVAVGGCRLHDESGPIGHVLVAGLAQTRASV